MSVTLLTPRKADAFKATKHYITSSIDQDSIEHNADSILFEKAIEHLKEYEGYRSEVYIDVDGSRTIGYGHHLLEDEYYTTVNKEFATSVLKKDLTQRVNTIKEKYNLDYKESLALGLFAYNIGMGGLDKAISKGLLKKIDKLLLYCNYTVTLNGEKVKVRSEKLKERREYELSLYQS